MTVCLYELLNHLAADLGPTDATAMWRTDATVKQVASYLLTSKIASKYVDNRPTHESALRKFRQNNETCANWAPPSQPDEILARLFGETRRLLDNFWHKDGLGLVSSIEEVFDYGDIGPGASVGAPGTDFYSKFCQGKISWSGSSVIRSSFERYVRSRRLWSEAFMANDPAFLTQVDGSKISFVPKNNEELRTIATEPLLNMFYQKGLDRILRARIQTFFGLNLRAQQGVNRKLARLGSVEGNLCTIDLRSASDLISSRLVEYLCHPSMVAWLRYGRCTHAVVDGERLRLEMWSTMGNGYTFSLQTILFAAAVRACYLVRGIRGVVAVNGDDIICDRKVYDDVVRLLTAMGFSVNTEKSFSIGDFRESCGGDYFRGHDVRPVYIKQLDGPQDTYKYANLLTAWSSKTGISLLNTLRYLTSAVKPRFVPPDFPIDSGYRVSLDAMHISGIGLSGEQRMDNVVYHNANGSPVVEIWLPSKPKVIRVVNDGIVGFNARRLRYNPPGLYLSLLKGVLRCNKITGRQPAIRYTAKRVVAPSWGCYDVLGFVAEDQRQRWNSAAATLQLLARGTI